MKKIFILLFGIIIGAVVVFKKRSNDLLNRPQSKRKEQAKQKILALLEQQEQITNNDVENLLNVSDSTATNYLEELEQANLITQKGKTGRNVFYTLK